MNSGLVPRRRRENQGRGIGRRMLLNSQGGLKKAIADDAEWEDEDSDEEWDSGLGSSSEATSDTQKSELRLEIARHKRHLKMSRRLIMKQSKVVNVLGGSGDPFGALPDTIGGSDLLVHHWNNVLAHSGVAGPRKDWFPFALQHPALFQATLFVAAASFDTANGRRMPGLFLSHRGEVMRTISSRLGNPGLAATDSTIGAVAMIYMVDSMRSSKDIAHAHLKGLQQLIFARGGLMMLDPRVQIMIMLVDLLGSTYLREPPHFADTRFENVAPTSLYGHPSLSTEKYAEAFAARLASFTGDSATSEACATIFWGLRNLTIILDSGHDKWHEGIEFSTRAEFLERNLRKLMDSLDAQKQDAESINVADANEHAEKAAEKFKSASSGQSFKYSDSMVFNLFGTAARIYILTTLQQLDTRLPVFHLLTRIIEETLTGMGDARLKTLLGTFPDMMLWVLFLGGHAAPWGWKGWFAKTATRVLLVKKVEERTGIEEAKDAFLWPEGMMQYDASPGNDVEKDIPAWTR